MLGTVRTLFVVPLIGERWAELLEMPLMLTVAYFAAKFVRGKFSISSLSSACFVGGMALFLLVLAEVTVVLSVRDVTLGSYIKSRDPVAFPAYLASLVVFSILPLVLQLSSRSRSA